MFRDNNRKVNYMTDSYGQEWVLKDSTIKVGNFDTGIMGKKRWFRVSDLDENKVFWITALLGSFGIHKYITGNFAGFIAYLITCGGFGVLTVLDTLQFLTGSAGYDEVTYFKDEEGRLMKNKERVYFRRLENRKAVLIGIICALFIGLILMKLVYKPVMLAVMKAVIGATANIDQDSLTGNLRIVDELFNMGIDY